MNKPALIFLIVVSALVLVAALLPLRRGAEMNCDDGVYVRMKEVGVPFAYYQTPGESGMICVPRDEQLYSATTRFTSRFNPAPLWFDLMLYGAVIIGTFLVIDNRKVIG